MPKVFAYSSDEKIDPINEMGKEVAMMAANMSAGLPSNMVGAAQANAVGTLAALLVAGRSPGK